MDRLISLQLAIDALGEEPEVWSGKDEYEQGLNNQWHYDVNALKALSSAQPVIDRTKISDLLEKIYSIQSVHLSAEGVIAKKYFCEELWKEIFGSEAELPAWMR